jgi:hypothetical protein
MPPVRDNRFTLPPDDVPEVLKAGEQQVVVIDPTAAIVIESPLLVFVEVKELLRLTAPLTNTGAIRNELPFVLN